MNSRQLTYFLAVARELNFTKAAESLYVSQTAVTQQIKVLEDQLGVHLFSRTKRKVTLTPAGKVFLEEALGVLNRMEMAVERTRAVSSGFTGTLKIGFTAGIGNTEISERIQAFHQTFPNIAMRFVSLSPSMLLKQLKKGELDLVLMPLFAESFYRDIQYKRLAWDRMMLVLPHNHVLAQKKYVTWSEIREEKLIMPSTPNSEIGEDQKIIESFLRIGCQPNVVDHIEDVETIFFMVSANMGITILPAYLVEPMSARGRLVSVPFSDTDAQMDLIAGWIEEKANPSLEKILPFLSGELQGDFAIDQGTVMLDAKKLKDPQRAVQIDTKPR